MLVVVETAGEACVTLNPRMWGVAALSEYGPTLSKRIAVYRGVLVLDFVLAVTITSNTAD